MFRLSQSTTLFDELKSKLIKILKSNHNHLSNDNFNLLINEFDNLERDYLDFFELTKSKYVFNFQFYIKESILKWFQFKIFLFFKRAKLKMAKYEKYVKTWSDFDSTCKRLDDIFERSSPENMSSLKVNFILFLLFIQVVNIYLSLAELYI